MSAVWPSTPPGVSTTAGALGSRYYLSMKDGAGGWHLLVYDLARGFWHREDATKAEGFAEKPPERLP